MSWVRHVFWRQEMRNNILRKAQIMRVTLAFIWGRCASASADASVQQGGAVPLHLGAVCILNQAFAALLLWCGPPSFGGGVHPACP